MSKKMFVVSAFVLFSTFTAPSVFAAEKSNLSPMCQDLRGQWWAKLPFFWILQATCAAVAAARGESWY